MSPQPDDPARNGTMRPANGGDGGPRVFDAEVLGPEDGDAPFGRGPAGGPRGAAGRSGPGAPGGGAFGGGPWRGPGGAGGPGAPGGPGGSGGAGGWGAPGGAGDSGAGRFSRMGGTFSSGGAGFGRVWTATGASGTSCLAPCITFALFFVCLSQFGLLAGLGFAVFHLVGSIAGSIRSMRLLVEGREVNPWSWRLGNWFVSFMLTVWLAGGFNG